MNAGTRWARVALLSLLALTVVTCVAARRGDDDPPGGGGGGGWGNHGGDDGPGGDDDGEGRHERGHHGDGDCGWDDGGWTYKGVVTCGAALDALAIRYTGATVFCPRNEDMNRLARRLGFTNATDLIADLTASGTSKTALDPYFRALVHPGQIITRDDIPEGITNLTTLNPDSTITLRKRTKFNGRVHVDLVFGSGCEGDDVRGFNLTFTGAYNNTTSGYIVHALEDAFPINATSSGGLDWFFKHPPTLPKGMRIKISLSMWKKLTSTALKANGLSTLYVPTDAAWKALKKDKSLKAKGYTLGKIRGKSLKNTVASYHLMTLTQNASKKPKVNYPDVGQITGQASSTNTANVLMTFQAGATIVQIVDKVLLP